MAIDEARSFSYVRAYVNDSLRALISLSPAFRTRHRRIMLANCSGVMVLLPRISTCYIYHHGPQYQLTKTTITTSYTQTDFVQAISPHYPGSMSSVVVLGSFAFLFPHRLSIICVSIATERPVNMHAMSCQRRKYVTLTQ